MMMIIMTLPFPSLPTRARNTKRPRNSQPLDGNNSNPYDIINPIKDLFYSLPPPPLPRQVVTTDAPVETPKPLGGDGGDDVDRGLTPTPAPTDVETTVGPTATPSWAGGNMISITQRLDWAGASYSLYLREGGAFVLCVFVISPSGICRASQLTIG